MQIVPFGVCGEHNLANPGKENLGGKGYHLYKMAEQGYSVPPGVIIPVSEYKDGRKINTKEFIDLYSILKPDTWLISVRSGAPVSMPGMMDTILNVGINNESLGNYIDIYGERFALDCYRRLIRMMGETCFDIPKEKFDKVYNHIKKCKYGSKGVPLSEVDFNIKHFENLVSRYIDIVKIERSIDIGELDFSEQLRICINAVWRSWMSERAIAYRKNNNISDDMGTAIVIQKMVFGNRNEDSCTGVLFTRNPNTGEDEGYGEFLVNAQGEDVVAGTVTPRPIHEMKKWNPSVFEELEAVAEKLETHYREMQDIEFTVEDGKLYILQTRTGKRSSQANFRIVMDMYMSGMIGFAEAKGRISVTDIAAIKKPMIDPEFKKLPLAIGIPAAGNIATGKAVFSSEDAINCSEPCILIKKETLPEDYSGMVAAAGILTVTGGATSHAAVVARSVNKPCVVGCTEIYASNLEAIFKDKQITIDGSTGKVWVDEEVPVINLGLNDYSKGILKLIGSDFKDGDYSVKPSEYYFYGSLISHPVWLRVDFTEESIEEALQTTCKRFYFNNETLFGVDESVFDSYMGLGNPKLDAEGVLAYLNKNIEEDDRHNYEVYLPDVSVSVKLSGFSTPKMIYNLKDLFKLEVEEGVKAKIDKGFLDVLESEGVEVEDIKVFFNGALDIFKEPESIEQLFSESIGS